MKKLEYQYKERLRLNVLYRDYLIDCVEKEYLQEKKAAVKEFEEKKIDLKETLISDLEDKKRTVEAERFSMELTGDSMEVNTFLNQSICGDVFMYFSGKTGDDQEVTSETQRSDAVA